MKENRYFFYPILVNMVSNIIVFVPHVLIGGRFQGALMSILVAIPIGMTLLICFTKSMEKFPGQSLPDILKKYLPPWVTWPFSIYIASFWYVYGALILIGYADITQRYLSPETGQWMILAFYGLAVLIVTPIKTSRFLFGLEVLMLFNLPLVFVILVKSITEKNSDWNGVLDICTHLFNHPTLTMVSAATFIFSGYANMVVLGKSFRYQMKPKHYALIALFGCMTLLTSFFVPIARLGEFAVSDYTVLWIAAADTVAMQYFVIERLMIPFLLVYLMVSLVTAMMTWHIGFTLIQSQIRNKKKWQTYALLAVFAAALYGIRTLFPDYYQLFDFVNVWLVVRLFSEVLLVLVVIYLARRKRRDEKA